MSPENTIIGGVLRPVDDMIILWSSLTHGCLETHRDT